MAPLDICVGNLSDGDDFTTIPFPIWQGGNTGEAAALRQGCQSALARAASQGAESLTFFCAGQTAYPPVAAATVILRSIMDFLAEHPLPEPVHLICATETTAEIFRQSYNLWYAEDKAHRL